MRIKKYIFIITILIISITLTFVYSCDDIVQIDNNKEDSSHVILCYLFDNITGEPLLDCNICVVSPLVQQEYDCTNDSLVIQNVVKGQYSVLVEKENYISETRQIEVQQTECESCGSVYSLYFYLTPMSHPVKIGKEGGDITFQDGTVLHFPEGALNEDINIIATQIPAPSHLNQLDLSRKRIPLMEINVMPEGLILNKPVELSIPIKLSENISSLSASHYNIETSSWEEIQDGTLNEDKTYLEFQVDHFSTISVISPYHIEELSSNLSSWKVVVVSPCGETANGTYSNNITLVGDYYYDGHITVGVSQSQTCSAKTNYIRKLWGRHTNTTYLIKKGITKCAQVTVPETPVIFECDNIPCHDQGGSQ